MCVSNIWMFCAKSVLWCHLITKLCNCCGSWHLASEQLVIKLCAASEKLKTKEAQTSSESEDRKTEKGKSKKKLQKQQNRSGGNTVASNGKYHFIGFYNEASPLLVCCTAVNYTGLQVVYKCAMNIVL